MTTTTARPASFAHVRAFEDLPHSCGRCPARWSGSRTAHCGACHITTTGEGAFLAHRAGGRCNEPAMVGLSLVAGRAYEVWGRTGEESG